MKDISGEVCEECRAWKTGSWARSPIMARFHFFLNGKALCGRWLFTGEGEPESEFETHQPNKSDCRVCWRKVQASRR